MRQTKTLFRILLITGLLAAPPAWARHHHRPRHHRSGRQQRAAKQRQEDLQALGQGHCAPAPKSHHQKKKYARRFFKLSIELAAQNKLKEALTGLECSFRAYPHYNTYYNYAKIAEKLGLFKEAIRAYRRYLALNPKATDAIDIEEKIEVIQKAIEQKRRKLEAQQREQEVKRLAEQLARQKLAAERRAQAETRKANQEKERARVLGQKKRQAELVAKLNKLKAEQAAAKMRLERELVAAKLAHKRRKFTTAAWILGGAGVAAIIAGAALGGISLADKYKVEHANQDEPWQGNIAKAYDRSKSFSLVGAITAGAGALLVVGAGALYGASRRIKVSTSDDNEKQSKPKARILPDIRSDGAGVTLSFSF